MYSSIKINCYVYFTAGEDYEPSVAPIFIDSIGVRNVEIRIIQDEISETDETFRVRLVSMGENENVVVDQSTATITIINGNVLNVWLKGHHTASVNTKIKVSRCVAAMDVQCPFT